MTPEEGTDRYAAITGDGTLTKILTGIVFPKGRHGVPKGNRSKLAGRFLEDCGVSAYS